MFSLDRWLPESLKGVEDRWQALQARVFLVLLLLFILPVIPAALIMATVSALEIINLWSLAIVAGVASVGVLACYYYFYHSANLGIASAIYAVLALLMVGAVVFYTGGWQSPVCVFLLTLPVLVSLVVDLRAGTLFAVLVSLFYGLLFLLHQQGYPFEQLVSSQHLLFTQNALWALTLLSLFASLLLYDYSEQNLSTSLAEDRAQLEQYAHHDSLTGVFNEQALLEIMEEGAVSHDHVETERLLAYIAVENTSGIANHFGFEVADLFIVEMVKKLQAELVEGAVLARYSGNAFVIFSAIGKEDEEYRSRFSGMVYRIRQWHGKPVVLPNQYRFLLDIKTGMVMIADRNIAAREIIDQARSHVHHE